MLTWRKLEVHDFPVLTRWLSEPHVSRWWHHDSTPEGVARDFGPGTRGEEPGEDLLVFLDDSPIGLVQRSRMDDYPEEFADMVALLELPAETVTVDYLIGDPNRVGQGLGPAVIREMVAQTWLDFPRTTVVAVAVVAANRASWRALEKAGAYRVAELELEPDNPIDDPLHYVYRFNRPSTST